MMNFLQKLFAPNIEKLESRRNVQGLIKALDHKEWNIRRDAVESLGRFKEARTVEPLITVLQDCSWGMRLAAVEALGQIGDARAVEPLITALQDRDSAVRKRAVAAFGQLGWQPAKDEAGARYWIATGEWGKCVEIGAPAVEPLITAFLDSDSDVWKGAATALGQIGAPAVEPLITVLPGLLRRCAQEGGDGTGTDWRRPRRQTPHHCPPG